MRRLEKVRAELERDTTERFSGTIKRKPLDCGRRITDSLIGQNVTILNHEHNLPKGHKLILGDKATVTP